MNDDVPTPGPPGPDAGPYNDPDNIPPVNPLPPDPYNDPTSVPPMNPEPPDQQPPYTNP